MIMRPLSLLFPASLLVLASGAFAQDQSSPQTSELWTVQVTASPAKGVWIDHEQARELAGSYSMSNGWHLRVRPAARHINAAIDGRQPMRLISVGKDRFVSADGNVTMEFKLGKAGDEMLMSYRPDPRLAQVVVISSRLAQR
jgi:hypothetical protein